MSPVAIVISDTISDPVASVPMNESIRITTTTIALITPIATPVARPEQQRGHERQSDRDEVSGDDAGQRHRVREREIEDARGKGNRDRQRSEGGDRVGVQDLLYRRRGGERVRHPDREHDDDSEPHVDGADLVEGQPADQALRERAGVPGGPRVELT